MGAQIWPAGLHCSVSHAGFRDCVTAKRPGAAPAVRHQPFPVESPGPRIRSSSSSGDSFSFALPHTTRLICTTNSCANKCQTCFSSVAHMFNKQILHFQPKIKLTFYLYKTSLRLSSVP